MRRTGLVVEDDADLRQLMVELLADAGMETMECESAEAALALMLIHGRKIVVVLTDVQLPGLMDGVDFAREIKLRWPSLPVVLTSGHGAERLRRDCRRTAYSCRKPWRGEDIVKLVEQAIASSERRTPSAADCDQRGSCVCVRPGRDPLRLRTLSVRPRESGDPGALRAHTRRWLPACAGTNGGRRRQLETKSH